MKSRTSRSLARTLPAALLLASISALAPSCKSSASDPAPGACPQALNVVPGATPFTPVADVADPVVATFTVTLDPKNPALDGDWRQPRPEAMTVAGQGGAYTLVGGAKRFANVTGRVMLELNLVSSAATGVRDLSAGVADVKGATAFYDLSADVLADASGAVGAPHTLTIGGIGPRGVSARIRVGLDVDPSATSASFTLSFKGTATARVATSSAPLAISPDGREVWAPFADSDSVAVIDTARDARVANVTVHGKPSSAAVTPDGAYALVTCSACNQLVVVDRATRNVVQIFGENEGIGRDPRNVVLSPDGARAYVSAYVGDSVTVLDRVATGFRVNKTIDVGRRPVGMSVAPDGASLFVAHFLPRGALSDNEGWISVVDTGSLAVSHEATLRDDANAKEASCLASIGAFSGFGADKLQFEAVPTQLSGVFLNPGGSVGWVPALRTAGFPIFEGDLSSLEINALAKGAFAPSILFPLDTRSPKDAAFRKVGSVVDITDRDLPFLRCVPATDDSEAVTATPGDNPGELQYLGVTIPSQSTMLREFGVSRFVGYSRGGRRALVLSYNADELSAMDAATNGPVAKGGLLLQGSNPTGLVVTPDGKKAYVAYENSTFASVVDLSSWADDSNLPGPYVVPYRMPPGDPGQATIITFVRLTRDVSKVPDAPPLRETAQIPLVDSDPMDPTLRRGKVLFTSSSPLKYPELTSHREASCSSCHPNGGNDGSAWATMEGERRTIGLWGGTAKRGWLHWSATHDSSHEFATVIVKERLGGTGLSDADADALSLYVARGIPEVQRPAVDAQLSSRGNAIFESQCTRCHSGPDHGSGEPDPNDRYGTGKATGPRLYDVGSATDWAEVTLSEAYTHLFPPKTRKVMDALRGDRALGASDDPVEATLRYTPRPTRARGALKAATLTNVWENALHFHDGRTPSLDAAVGDITGRVGIALSDDDRRAVVEFLKTL